MENKSGFDLGDLDTTVACDKGIEIELLHPASRDKLGVFVTVLGADSSAVKELLTEFRRSNERQAATYKRQGKAEFQPSSAMFEEFILNKAIVATTGWRTADKASITLKSEELAFNVANAKKVFTQLPWVHVQVLQAIDDLQNFMPS